MRFSVVVPVYNEQDNVLPLAAEMAALAGLGIEEILLVDDGSTDATPRRLREAQHRHPGLRVLRHGARRGQSAAIRSGVQAARAPWVATLDGDGQNDPRDLALLVEAACGPRAGDGLALVAGLRRVRRDPWTKRAASRLANAVRNALLHDGCPDTGCGLKLFRRDAFLALPFFAGMHRFLPALFQMHGHRVLYVPVSHRPRLSGRSKYANLPRALVGLVDLLGVWWLRRRTPAPVPVEEQNGPAT
ncbi:MAG: glycosyltransferase family 2 protein [Rhodospirillaceae bacterium]|nr:glycosyltransferase family 2 protein [Rhodospirillaceae bacterium]